MSTLGKMLRWPLFGQPAEGGEEGGFVTFDVNAVTSLMEFRARDRRANRILTLVRIFVAGVNYTCPDEGGRLANEFFACRGVPAPPPPSQQPAQVGGRILAAGELR